VQVIPAHKYEVLSCEWNKYNPNLLLTGSVDKEIRAWVRLPPRCIAAAAYAPPVVQDIRKAVEPVRVMRGHQFAVRRLKCSPHNERTVLSAS
jgi:peroxin-7